MGVWVGKWGWERCGWEREIKGDTKDLCKEGGREGRGGGGREADVPSEGSAFSMTLLHMSSMYLSLTS